MKLASFRLPVRPSHHSAAARRAAVGLLLWLWARRPGDIHRLLHGRRSAANASSVTSTDVESCTQSCLACENRPTGLGLHDNS